MAPRRLSTVALITSCFSRLRNLLAPPSRAVGGGSGGPVFEELRRRNPLLAIVLERMPDYFLRWREDELGIFIWRVWQSLVGVDDEGRRRVEEVVERAINDKSTHRKLRRAAKIAKELIERDKEMLNIR